MSGILKTWCEGCECNPILPPCGSVQYFVYDFVPLVCETLDAGETYTLRCLSALSDTFDKTRRIFKVGQANPGAPDVLTGSGLLGNETAAQTIVTPTGVLRVGQYHTMFYARDTEGNCAPCNIDGSSSGACVSTWADVDDVVLTCDEAKALVTCGSGGGLDYCVRWVSQWMYSCDTHAMEKVDETHSHNCDDSLINDMDETGCSGYTYGPVHHPNAGNPLPADNDAPNPPAADESICCPEPPPDACQAWISFTYDVEHCVWVHSEGPTQIIDPSLFHTEGEETVNGSGGPILTRYGAVAAGTTEDPCPATVDDSLPTATVDFVACEKQWNDSTCGSDGGTLIIQNGVVLVAPGDGVGCAEFHGQFDTCLLGGETGSYTYTLLNSGIPLADGTGAAWLAAHGEMDCPTITESM